MLDIMVAIGLLSYREKALEAIPPLRLRALLAEARLQDASFSLLNSGFFDVHDALISANVWSLQGGWATKTIQLPDVIIIVGSPLNQHQKLLDGWVRSARPVIADKGLDKIALSQLLKQSKFEKYLIHCASIPKDDAYKFIRSFLLEHTGGVVKRATGNRGVGLFFIHQSENEWRLNSDGDCYKGSLDDVTAYIEKRISGRLQYREYLAQPYINSRTADGRPFDIRVHVQRGEDGEWGVTRAYVRIAEVSSPLPNTSKGGYQGAIKAFLNQKSPENANALETELSNAALEIAAVQSASAPLPLSELGLDFIIDQNDKIWLVETNALPQSSLHEHDRAVHTIGYAKFLAKYSNSERHAQFKLK